MPKIYGIMVHPTSGKIFKNGDRTAIKIMYAVKKLTRCPKTIKKNLTGFDRLTYELA